MDAENCFQVFDWLWSSGQLSAADIEKLPNYKIQHVINIALPTSNPRLEREAELITGLGINYFHIPVTWENPEPEKLATFIALLTSLKGQPTWVHCAKNYRVSAFIYLFRKLHLQEQDEIANFPMKEIWQPNEVWAEFILQAKSNKLG